MATGNPIIDSYQSGSSYQGATNSSATSSGASKTNPILESYRTGIPYSSLVGGGKNTSTVPSTDSASINAKADANKGVPASDYAGFKIAKDRANAQPNGGFIGEAAYNATVAGKPPKNQLYLIAAQREAEEAKKARQQMETDLKLAPFDYQANTNGQPNGLGNPTGKSEAEIASMQAQLAEAQKREERANASYEAAKQAKSMIAEQENAAELQRLYAERMAALGGYGAVFDDATSRIQELEALRDRYEAQLNETVGAPMTHSPEEHEAWEAEQKKQTNTYTRLIEDITRQIARERAVRDAAGGSLSRDTSVFDRVRAGEAKEAELMRGTEALRIEYGIGSGFTDPAESADFLRDIELGYHPADDWTPEERVRYYYILGGEGGEKAAREYAAQVRNAISDRNKEEETKGAREAGAAADKDIGGKAWAGAKGLAYGVLSIPSHVTSYMEKMTNALYALGTDSPALKRDRVTLSDRSDAFAQGRASQLNADYGTIPDDIPIIGGKGAGDLYMLGQSMAQSLVLGNVVGEGATLAGFFFQAADNAYDEAIDRGYSAGQALLTANLAGVAEVVGEKISLEELLHGNPGSFALGLLKQAGFEGTEEVTTDVLNAFFDQVSAKMTGQQSGAQREIEALVAGGMSRDEATKRIWQKFAEETAFDFVGGFISGGGSSLIQQGARTRKTGAAKTGNNLYDMRVQQQEDNSQSEQGAKPEAPKQNRLYEQMRAKNTQQSVEAAKEATNAAAQDSVAPADVEKPEKAQADANTQTTLESRRADWERRFEDAQARAESAAETDWAALGEEFDALDEERRALEDEETQQQRVQGNEVSTAYGTEANHVDRRTFGSVAAPGVKAFQFDHPQLHAYYVEAAQALMSEAQAATEQTAMRAGKAGSAAKGLIRRLMDMGLTKPRILQCLQDIIDNNGAENYADAKRVELILNEMLTDGWRGMNGEFHDPVAAYVAAKEKIPGAVKADSWEKYLADKETAIALGEVTEDDVRAEWEARQAANTKTADNMPAEQPANGNPQYQAPVVEEAAENNASSSQNAADTRDKRAPFTPPAGLNTKTQKREGRFSSRTLRATETAAGIPENERHRFIYETRSEGQSVQDAAARLKKDYSGEVQKLREAEAWSGTQVDMAAQISHDLYKKGETEAHFEWLSVMHEHANDTGRGNQAWAKYSRKDGESALDRVASEMGKNGTLTEEQRQALMQRTMEAAKKLDEALADVASAKNEAEKTGNPVMAPQSLLDLIKSVADDRRTSTFFKGTLDKVLNAQRADVDYLTDFAYQQIVAMANDYTAKRSMAEYVKTFQTLAHLTSVATFGRNVLGNVTFGTVDTLAKDAFGVALDRVVSRATGKRSVAFDRGYFSRESRAGGIDALQKSILEVALDVDMSDGASIDRYGRGQGRTNKMAGNAIERFFSRWEQLLNYSLSTSDRVSRGMIEAENQRGLEALKESGTSAEEQKEIREAEADYRLFQNHGHAYKFSKGAHDVLNVAGFGGEIQGNQRIGGFGVGDIVNPYPGVPANLGVKPLEYSPLNILKGGIELVKLWLSAKNGQVDAAKQYQAVMDIARGLSGVPIIALFAALSKVGLIKDWDEEEDKDAKAMNSAEGKSGIQFNLSGALRWLNGEAADWRDGDTVDSVGYLEPINAFMSIGALISGLDDDATLLEYAKKYAQGAARGALAIPVMSNISNMIDTYNYADEDEAGGKLGQAVINYAGNTLTGFIPSPIRGVAKASDAYYRDTSAASAQESAKNSLFSALPWLRGKLPEKLDGFGAPKTYGGDTGARFLNALVNPGNRDTIRQSAESAYLFELRDKTGNSGVIPDRKAPNSLNFGSGSEKLSPEEKRHYQETAGQLYQGYVAEMMQDEWFLSLDPEEQADIIGTLYSAAKEQAKNRIAAERGYEPSGNAAGLFAGKDAPGTRNDIPALDAENAGEYLSYTAALGGAINRGDYAAVDNLLLRFSGLSQNTQDVVSARNPSSVNKLLEYVRAGSGAESYYILQEATDAVQAAQDSDSEGSHIKLAAIASANIPEEEKAALISSGAFETSKGIQALYPILQDTGLTPAEISEWFDAADWSAASAGKDPRADGSINAYEAAVAISRMDRLTTPQREALFEKLKGALGFGKKQTYKSALASANANGRISGRP